MAKKTEAEKRAYFEKRAAEREEAKRRLREETAPWLDEDGEMHELALMAQGVDAEAARVMAVKLHAEERRRRGLSEADKYEAIIRRMTDRELVQWLRAAADAFERGEDVPEPPAGTAAGPGVGGGSAKAVAGGPDGEAEGGGRGRWPGVGATRDGRAVRRKSLARRADAWLDDLYADSTDRKGARVERSAVRLPPDRLVGGRLARSPDCAGRGAFLRPARSPAWAGPPPGEDSGRV